MAALDKHFALADAHYAVERLALSGPQQVEWLSRDGRSLADQVGALVETIRSVVAEFAEELSPVLRLRLEALVTELDGADILGAESPDQLIRQSSWAGAAHLAQKAVHDPGWPQR